MSVAAVYRMRNEKGELLYVGMSLKVPTRLAAHKVEKDWWPEVTRVDIEHFDSWRVASAAEADAIEHENPKHNRQPGRLIPFESPEDRDQRKALSAERAAENRKRFELAQRARHMYPVRDLACGHCGWAGAWIKKGLEITDVECPNCGLKQLTGTPEVLTQEERQAA